MFIRISSRVLAVAGSLLLGACGTTRSEPDAQSIAQESQKQGTFCGGFAGFGCAEGSTCVDDPNDSCDPEQGGADCGGICVKEKDKDKDKDKDLCEDPARIYVSTDPEVCATIRFFCAEDQMAFFDECGCGCEPAVR
jgi:hypothetical protein